MSRFVIRGGRRLSGRHRPSGNKNAALPMLTACLLTDEPIVLSNIPRYEDVHTMLHMLEGLGVSVDLRGHTVKLCARGLRRTRLDADLCRAVRSSILFAGPMSARLGRLSLYPPGGDGIGRRPLDTHFSALKQLGIEIQGRNPFRFSCKRLKSADILLSEASVTATENVLMAAVLAPGTTTVFNAACEPHVSDLCRMLNSMGAKISGAGTNFLTVDGVESLHGVRHRLEPDYIEIVSFMAAAAITGGSLEIVDPPLASMQVFSGPLEMLGLRWSYRDGNLVLPADQKLKIKNDYDLAVPKIEDGPWPGFPSDLMSVAILVAARASGNVLFFEKMFESRMYFVDRLIEMGARIVQCDPHRVMVNGPSRLRGIHMSSPDIRAGMAMLLAALCAEGESVIDSAELIDRGYEHVEHKLRKLGADIVRRN